MSTTLTTKPKSSTVLRGQVYWVDLFQQAGCETGSIRPCLVIQNNLGNLKSPTCIFAVISSSMTKTKLPVHVYLKAEECDLPKNSFVSCEQLKSLDQFRIMDYITTLTGEQMKEVNKAIKISLALEE